MGKHKKVLKGAVSEMKHFLMGAALVLTLVTVVPALAQEVRSGDRPSLLPSAGGDAGLRSAGDSRGQAGADMRQGRSDQAGARQSVEPRTGQGQRGADVRQGQQGTDARQGQQGADVRQGQQGTDARQGRSDQAGARQSVEPRTGQGRSDQAGARQSVEPRTEQGRSDQAGARQSVEPRTEQEVSEKPIAKRQSEIKIQLIDFDDLEEDYTSSVAVSAVAESIVDPARAAIESGTISQKKIKSFVSKVSKALRASEKQVCATFEIKDDRKACADIHKSFRNDSRNIKSTEALDEALQVFMDDLNALAEISVDVEDDLLEEDGVE